MATVGVNQLLLLLDFSSLHVLEDMNVALIGRDEEVAILDEYKHV